MKRQDTALVAAALGAVLVAAGALGIESVTLVSIVGGAAAGAGLASLGTRGSVALFLTGGWLVASGFVGVAVTTWNMFAGGLLVVALGFLVGAVGTAADMAVRVPGEE